MHYYSFVTEENQADYYEAIRVVLGPAYANISDAEADQMISGLLADMSSEEQENLLRSLGRVAKSVGRTAVRALPTVAPIAGGIIGTAVGGPAGTAIGGAIGQAVGGLAAPAAQRAAPRRRQRVVRRVPVARRRPARRAPRPVVRRRRRPRRASLPRGATRQLLSLLQNPQFLISLLGQLTNRREAIDIAVRGEAVQVPFAAFMNTLSYLAQEAASEATIASEGASPEYLMDAQGNYLVDPTSDQERSQLLMDQLMKDMEAREERLDAQWKEYQTDTLDKYDEDRIEEEDEYDDLTEWFIEQGMI